MRLLALILFFIVGWTPMFSQVKVYLSNGEVIEAKIGNMKHDLIKLKDSKNDKNQKIKAKEVDSVLVFEKGKQTIYHALGKRKKSFYELCQRGKVNIYVYQSTAVTGYGNFTSTFYALKRPNDAAFADFSNNWKWFYKLAEEYFPDCPTLIEKIKNEEDGFSRKDMKNIGEFYNKNCGS